MKRKALAIVLWVACGFYAYGTLMAEMDWSNRNEWQILNRGSRDNVGMCAYVAVIGPIGAIATAGVSNFNQHGWELWQKGTR